ncbi:polyketide cyclase / dehydrase and lipid transport family protein [Mycobacterium ulcerans str. Harvey]|uniref:Polyketide cyclase / dehydrase and lipid transport family protein n=1 Tax=Mycobacterium ulcerans str. Harvey TaxID=1299332 RepID=A0ABN0QMG3_MYCUL|nr:polyketide cyclase / dehydrase and lipid transport family protein [Mycobacterium ulcerans str. Harvey]
MEASTWIDAEPERVWSLISDIALMPTLSNELQAVEWVGGVSEPRVGARFIGHNQHEAFGQWTSTSQVVRCDPPANSLGPSVNPTIRPRCGGFVWSPATVAPT